MSADRLGRLRALANDPAATDAERALAREHIAKMGPAASTKAFDDQPVDVSDELIAAMDRAMARVAGMRGRRQTARIHAAEARLGLDAKKAWIDSRGLGLGRAR